MLRFVGLTRADRRRWCVTASLPDFWKASCASRSPLFGACTLGAAVGMRKIMLAGFGCQDGAGGWMERCAVTDFGVKEKITPTLDTQRARPVHPSNHSAFIGLFLHLLLLLETAHPSHYYCYTIP
ncbi:hypothetical protein P154DRAFT_211040 [Amniculicola lignicola CBS 123094]|uniref:Uncharacterized protein n=1 Tax=Amniculicola lignicola CBS 123094 TaxID=1392246 RepID=A0A6A5WE35_9PLEO|nr:hypothetical protein P154DRAFT_211040 [Amniculicola lignicola CBS 123094]